MKTSLKSLRDAFAEAQVSFDEAVAYELSIPLKKREEKVVSIQLKLRDQETLTKARIAYAASLKEALKDDEKR